MSQLKFWYAPGACSMAPHILLREVGADFEGIPAAITVEGADFPAGFKSINPKMRIPVLSIDGEIITEVPAIATAISAFAPEKHLMGRNTLETVRVYELMIWLSGTLHGHGFGGLWRPQRYSEDATAYPGIQEKAMQNLRDYFAQIEEKIAGPFALGDAFTAVDAYLYVFYRWGNGIGLDLDHAYPKFAALGRSLASRASIVAATTYEQVDPHGQFVA